MLNKYLPLMLIKILIRVLLLQLLRIYRISFNQKYLLLRKDWTNEKFIMNYYDIFIINT
jgi:hypothetical protein